MRDAGRIPLPYGVSLGNWLAGKGAEEVACENRHVLIPYLGDNRLIVELVRTNWLDRVVWDGEVAGEEATAKKRTANGMGVVYLSGT